MSRQLVKQTEAKADRINGELHRFVKQLNKRGYKNVTISEADIDKAAELFIDNLYSIEIPVVALNRSFDYTVRLANKNNNGYFKTSAYKKLDEAIQFIDAEYERRAKAEKNQKIQETNKTMATKRTSPELEGKAKREAELKEVEQDIEATTKAIATFEASYKGVNNALCDFEELSTERPMNDKLLQRLEKASDLVDAVYEEMKQHLASLKSGRETVVKLLAAHDKEQPKDKAKGKQTEKPEGDKKPSKQVDGRSHEAKVAKVNEFLPIFVDELKGKKVRVQDTVKATLKRNGLVRLSRGRQFEITHQGKLILTDGDKSKTFNVTEANKAVKLVATA